MAQYIIFYPYVELAGCTVIFSISIRANNMKKNVFKNILVDLGKKSYSIYLVHTVFAGLTNIMFKILGIK